MVYLTLFAACKYYPMIDSSTAFALMLLTVLAGSGLALMQQSQALAILATTGGFLGTATDVGRLQPICLRCFSYYGLLKRRRIADGLVAAMALAKLDRFYCDFRHRAELAATCITTVLIMRWCSRFFAVYFLMYLLIGYWFYLASGASEPGFYRWQFGVWPAVVIF